ncbi:MAG: thioredoxin domain-containing protein [Phycisphaerae bacterium]
MSAEPKARTEIEWLEWGPEVFDKAREEDKLILLDSGATWCHWCHVMDRETYEDTEVISVVNHRYIPVRIDRDKLPEVDAQYQRAIPLTGPGGGGWPLTAILTPEGHVVYKGTFVPPRTAPRYGPSVGLVQIMERLDEYWRENRKELEDAGKEVSARLDSHLREAASQSARPSNQVLRSIIEGTRIDYDGKHGGFGTAPKFFNASALELLLAESWKGDETSRDMLLNTLEKMASGGVYDHLAGGFHRYSVDREWHVPHFEKMAYDNAALLGLYANAYALTGNTQFRQIAEQTLDWTRHTLLHPGREGFYASQDADVGLDDDGDYFTWTPDEMNHALSALDQDLRRAVMGYYLVEQEGDMHNRPGKNVLHVPKPPEKVAQNLGQHPDEVQEAVRQAKDILLEARKSRPAPKVDETIFADLNGMMVDAWLTAAERFSDHDARTTALEVLDALLVSLRDSKGVFGHHRENRALQVVGLLGDQAWMLRALLHAFTLTLREEYLSAARATANYILSDLTAENGAFLTSPIQERKHPGTPIGIPDWTDSPSRSAASVAAQSLYDLALLSGDDTYADAAWKALVSYAGAVRVNAGLYLAGYGQAVDHAVNGPRTVILLGTPNSRDARDMERIARETYVPGGCTLLLDPSDDRQAMLADRLGYESVDKPAAFVCRGEACLNPAMSPSELKTRLADLSGQESPSGV